MAIEELANEVMKLLETKSYGDQEDMWNKFILVIQENESLALCTSCCRLHCSGYCNNDSHSEW